MAPQLLYYSDKCTGCGACFKGCPNGAIRFTPGEKPETDRRICNACKVCATVCPAEAREITGYTVTVEAALKEVKKDKLFMDDSGGGMTISGGEPLMQPAFSAALFQAAKEEGIHTAIETCNYASRTVIEQVYPYVDLAICDIKHMDPEKHKELTGVSNEIILDNILYIRQQMKKPMNIRTPIVPGYNGDPENIIETARFIYKNLGSDVIYSLLPYHRMGESKSAELELSGYELHVTPPDDAYMQQLAELVEKEGVTAHIGG